MRLKGKVSYWLLLFLVEVASTSPVALLRLQTKRFPTNPTLQMSKRSSLFFKVAFGVKKNQHSTDKCNQLTMPSSLFISEVTFDDDLVRCQISKIATVK